MAFDWDETSPATTATVSTFPANEQAFRLVVKTAVDVEHDEAEMRHKFGRGTNETRDGITTWVDGSVWWSTDEIAGETVPLVYNGSAWVPPPDYGLIDTMQFWTAAQGSTWVALTDNSGTLEWDGDTSHYWKFTLANSTAYTLGTPTGTLQGTSNAAASYTFEITQAPAVAATLALHADLTQAWDATMVIDSALNSVTLIHATLRSDGEFTYRIEHTA